MLTIEEREKIREILEDFQAIPNNIMDTIPTEYYDDVVTIDDIQYHSSTGLEIYFIPLDVPEELNRTICEARRYLEADWLKRIKQVLGNNPIKYQALAGTWETLWK